MALPRQSEFNTNLVTRDSRICGAGFWAYGKDPNDTYIHALSWIGWNNVVFNPFNNQEWISTEFYYDAAWAFYQIADYTGDPEWAAIASKAAFWYLNCLESVDPPRYAQIPPSAGVNAINLFPHGLFLEWQRNPDANIRLRAQKALMALGNAGSYGVPFPAFGAGAFIPDLYSAREVGYNLLCKYVALQAGYRGLYGADPWGLTNGNADGDLLALTYLFCDQAIDLLKGGTGGLDAAGNPIFINHRYVRPFMMANLGVGLIAHFEATGDSRVLPKLQELFDRLWSVCFMPNGITLPNTLPDGSPAPVTNYTYGINALAYTDQIHTEITDWSSSGLGAFAIPNNVWWNGRGFWEPPFVSSIYPVPDLNGLILPVYYWLFQQTGAFVYRDRCDLLFDGMVRATSANTRFGTETGVTYDNDGKSFNQAYTRIWPYVAASVTAPPPPPPPTAFVSVKTGAWTDPTTWGLTSGFPTTGTTATISTNHRVTLTADAVVGKGLADFTDALALHGVLDLNGFALTVQGPVSGFDEGTPGRTSLTGGAGSSLTLDATSGTRYWLNPQNTTIVLTGTAATPCRLQSKPGALTCAIYSSNLFDGLLLTYTVVTDLVDLDTQLIGQRPFATSGYAAGNHVLDHCHFVRCGFWAQSVGTLTITNSTWTNTVAGASVDYRSNNANNPILRNNVFDQWVGSTTKGSYTGNMFLGNFLTWIDFGDVNESSNNFIRATGTNCINPQGLHTETALFYDDDLVNPHLCPNTTHATINGWLISSTGLDNTGDGFLGFRQASTITRTIFLTTADNRGFVTYMNLINHQPGATVAFTRNTCVGCSQGFWGIVSESDAGATGLLAAVTNNIFYGLDDPAQASVISFMVTRSVPDVGLAANLDYNDKWLTINGTVYDQNDLHPTVVNGYDNMRFTNGALPGVHDQTVNPNFVEPRNPVFYDQTILGLHPSVWAAGQTYQPGQQVQAATPTYWANRPANFTCILVTQGVNDSITRPMLGSNWRAYWRYTVLYKLSRLNELDYDSRFATPLMLAWVRAGYVPQNVLVRQASDGTWIGAQSGQPTDLFRQEEYASLLARAGSYLLRTEQLALAPPPPPTPPPPPLQGAPLPPAPVETTVSPAKRTVNLASLADVAAYLGGTFSSAMTWGDDVVLALGNYGAPAQAFQFRAATTIQGVQTGNDYITFRSANLSSLPPNGARITPADFPNMPALTAPPGDFLFRMPVGANHIRFVGLRMLGSPTSVSAGILFQSDSPLDLSTHPHHCFVDRCSIEGDAVQGMNEGIQGAGAHLGVTGCRFRNIFHPQGGEPHDILFATGHGPYLVENNDVEVGCIGLFVGDSIVNIPGVIPADITVRRNLFYKPDKWNYYKYLYNVGTVSIAADGTTATISGGTASGTWLDGQTYFAPTNVANQGTFAGQPSTSRLITGVSGQTLTLTPAWPDDGSRGQAGVPYRVTLFNGVRIIAIQFKNLYECKHGERILLEDNVFAGATQDAQATSISLCATAGSGATCRDVLFQYNYLRAGPSGVAAPRTRPTGGLSQSFQTATLTQHTNGLYRVTTNAATGVNTGDTVILAGFTLATTANGTWAATKIDNLSFAIPVPWVTNDSCGLFGDTGLITTHESGGVTKRVSIVNNVLEDVGDFYHAANAAHTAININTQPILSIASDAALSDTGDWYVDDIRIEHNTVVSPSHTVATPGLQVRMFWCLTSSPNDAAFATFWRGRRWTIRNNVTKVSTPASSSGPAFAVMTNEGHVTATGFVDSAALDAMTDPATRICQYNVAYSPWNNGDVASEYAALTGPEAFPVNSVQFDASFIGYTAPTVPALASYVLQPLAIGTASATNGSATVVFNGALPTTIAKGTPFKLTADGVFYLVVARVDATHVTLDRAYTGTTKAGAFVLGYQGWSSDGTDPGADIPAVINLTRGCMTGVWT